MPSTLSIAYSIKRPPVPNLGGPTNCYTLYYHKPRTWWRGKRRYSLGDFQTHNGAIRRMNAHVIATRRGLNPTTLQASYDAHGAPIYERTTMVSQNIEESRE